MNLFRSSEAKKPSAIKYLDNGQFVEILGASYGPTDVTEKVRSLYQEGVKTIKAENSVFGETWKGTTKSLYISYRHCEDSKTVTVMEGNNIVVPEAS